MFTVTLAPVSGQTATVAYGDRLRHRHGRARLHRGLRHAHVRAGRDAGDGGGAARRRPAGRSRRDVHAAPLERGERGDRGRATRSGRSPTRTARPPACAASSRTASWWRATSAAADGRSTTTRRSHAPTRRTRSWPTRSRRTSTRSCCGASRATARPCRTRSRRGPATAAPALAASARPRSRASASASRASAAARPADPTTAYRLRAYETTRGRPALQQLRDPGHGARPPERDRRARLRQRPLLERGRRAARHPRLHAARPGDRWRSTPRRCPASAGQSGSITVAHDGAVRRAHGQGGRAGARDRLQLRHAPRAATAVAGRTTFDGARA